MVDGVINEDIRGHWESTGQHWESTGQHWAALGTALGRALSGHWLEKRSINAVHLLGSTGLGCRNGNNFIVK